MKLATQASLFEGFNAAALKTDRDVESAVTRLSLGETDKSHGSVYTKPEVVDFILDLAGYKKVKPLWKLRLLEPSFGGGDFLLPIIDRLISSVLLNGMELTFENLSQCIRAVELHRNTYLETKRKVLERLESDIPQSTATRLTDAWLIQGDFLIEVFDEEFDFVVGNPPYVRQELIPAPLLAEYKARYSTIYDRADLYIPFIERSLSLLKPTGVLGFICSDRWMKNRYGGPLRSFVSRDFHLAVYVDMVGTDAFTEEVAAYPAITIFNRTLGKQTATVHRPKISHTSFAEIAGAIERDDPGNGRRLFKSSVVQREGSAPWILESSDRIDLLRRIESDFPAIEQTGCRIGIGVATGADKCFIGPFDSLDVEKDRKLPLATTKDIVSGEVRWRGLGIINPFFDDGGLVDLDRYPPAESIPQSKERNADRPSLRKESTQAVVSDD